MQFLPWQRNFYWLGATATLQRLVTQPDSEDKAAPPFIFSSVWAVFVGVR